MRAAGAAEPVVGVAAGPLLAVVADIRLVAEQLERPGLDVGAPVARLGAEGAVAAEGFGEVGDGFGADGAAVAGEGVGGHGAVLGGGGRGECGGRGEVPGEEGRLFVHRCLEAAGTSFENVVIVRIYAANAGFYNVINRVYARHFPDNFPSRSFVPVSGWFMEFDIEVEVQAVM
jgi:hypothetical protein